MLSDTLSIDFSLDGEENRNPLQDLKSQTLNERFSPEVLPYASELVADLMELCEGQMASVEDERDHFKRMIYSQDIERVKYALRVYLRIRLWKIEQQALYILHDNATLSRLSEEEARFCQRYTDLMTTHLLKSSLSELHTTAQSLTDKSNVENMIPEPQLDDSVFLRVTENSEDLPVELPNGETIDLTFVKNALHIRRYSHIRDMIDSKKVTLV